MEKQTLPAMKGEQAAPSETDAALGRVINLISNGEAVTVAEAERLTGAVLTPTALRDLKSHLTMLATAPCLERPEKRALVCICRPDRAREAVQSDVVLVSMLRMRRADQNQMFSRADLARFIPMSFQGPFNEAFIEREQNGQWPEGIGAILRARAMQVFLLEDLPRSCDSFWRARPQQSTKTASEPREESFVQAFEQAYTRLDRQQHEGQRISLRPLREALSAFDREQFETGLQFLHSSGRFALEGPDGQCGDLGSVSGVLSEWSEAEVFVTRTSS